MMKLLVLFVGLFCLANAVPVRKGLRGHAVDEDRAEFRDIGSNLEVRSIDEILNTERFKNIPVIFLEDVQGVRNLGRNVPKKKAHQNQRRVSSNRFHDEVKPLIKRTHSENHSTIRDLPERLRNIPVIFADQSFAFPPKFNTRNNIDTIPERKQKPTAFDDDDEEDQDSFDFNKDDDEEFEDEEEEEPMPMPIRKPMNRRQHPMMNMNMSPVKKTPNMQQYMMQMRPENFNFNKRPTINTNRQRTTPVKSSPTDVIELPIPRKLDIVAFITRDGSIYEIDNVNENSPMPISDKETSTLKDILKKTIAVKNVMASEDDKETDMMMMKEDKMDKEVMPMMMEEKDKEMTMDNEKTESVATDSTPSEETAKTTKKSNEKVEVETIKVRK